MNGKDVKSGSNLVTISSGPHLTDALLSFPLVQNEDISFPTIATGGVGFICPDPSEEPTLAIVLRLSIVKHRARQTAEDTAGMQQEATSTYIITNQAKNENMLSRA